MPLHVSSPLPSLCPLLPICGQVAHSRTYFARRSVVEQYFGKKFEAFKPMPKWEFYDYLGWGEQGDGKLFYGIYIQVGGAAFTQVIGVDRNEDAPRALHLALRCHSTQLITSRIF